MFHLEDYFWEASEWKFCLMDIVYCFTLPFNHQHYHKLPLTL